MQQIGRLAHATQLRAGDSFKFLWQSGSGAHEDSIISISKDAVNGHSVASDKAVEFEVDTKCLNLSYFLTYHVLRQTVLWYAVHQHSSRLFLTFIYGHHESFSCQVAGYSKSCWTGTDDSHFAASLLWQQLSGKIHVCIEVGYECLKPSNLNRLAFLVHHAMTLTLLLMRAHTTADSWQVTRFINNAHC